MAFIFSGSMLPLAVRYLSGSLPRKEDFKIINRELANFSEELAGRQQIVAGNKCDMATPEQIASFRAFVEEQGFFTDMKILFKTVGVVLRGDGAY